MMRVDSEGRGHVNIMDATKLINNPGLYSTFLLWLLAELFEELPEVGDPDKPGLVFFFDEAHLLFNDAPKALLEKIDQTVKLIRSKGVGVYFVTQNPRDLPESVLAQLGNRIQHALRAYTPNERRAVKAAAGSFRANDAFDTEDTITQLGVGEALVSTLDDKGAPSVVQRTLIRPPSSRLGPILADERRGLIQGGPLMGVYDTEVDRESAYEHLERRAAALAQEEEAAARREEAEKRRAERSRATRRTPTRRTTTRRRRSSAQTTINSVLRQSSNTLVREIVRGIFGSLRRR